MQSDPGTTKRLGAWDRRVQAGRRFLDRAIEWFFWDVWCWMYRRAMGIEGNPSPRAITPRECDTLYSAGMRCRNEMCRYFTAFEKTMLWTGKTFFVNLCLFIVLVMIFWIYTLMGMASPILPYKLTAVYCASQLIFTLKFVDSLVPAVDRRDCCGLHWTWIALQKLRTKKPGLHCLALCLMALLIWFLEYIHMSTMYFIYCSILLVSLILRFPIKQFDKARDYFMIYKEWKYDSDVEDDEFLPVVTEANLLVLTRVGETGDHSPTPTSVQSDTQNDSFYDEDFLEVLQKIEFHLPFHEEGSTDGVELSEPELSVGENDAEEDGIKFQTGHFKKSSSSSSEEEVFDAKKIAASSDESNGDSDFEVIDKEEIAKIKI